MVPSRIGLEYPSIQGRSEEDGDKVGLGEENNQPTK